MKNLIRFDWAVKRLLRNKANFGILEGFLSELLNEDIKIENILDIPHIDTVLTICAHPQKCIVCSFDFEKYFGGRWPPYKLKYEGKEYDNDARPVCPNCHATLYRSW